MNVDDLYGTMYSPGDGTIDPSSWTAALSKGATMRGAKVLVLLLLLFYYYLYYCFSL